jgi:hypothetical protein
VGWGEGHDSVSAGKEARYTTRVSLPLSQNLLLPLPWCRFFLKAVMGSTLCVFCFYFLMCVCVFTPAVLFFFLVPHLVLPLPLPPSLSVPPHHTSPARTRSRNPPPPLPSHLASLQSCLFLCLPLRLPFSSVFPFSSGPFRRVVSVSIYLYTYIIYICVSF